MCIYGYCRISTPKQSIDRQIRNIKNYNAEAVIVQEEYTGATLNRPNWKKLYKKLKTGDTIIFDEVSRMSRNAEEGFALYEELFNRGINLVFIKEPHINTETYRDAIKTSIKMTGTDVDCILKAINQYLLTLAKKQIIIAFEQAEKELQDNRQRTKEGIATARLNGKQIGQKSGAKLTTKKSIAKKEIILKLSKDFNGTLPDKELLPLTQLSRNTYYKYKRELKAELAK